MTEITTYECDFCGQVFDDEAECIHHEWKCRYEELCKSENCEPLIILNVMKLERWKFIPTLGHNSSMIILMNGVMNILLKLKWG